MSDVLTLDASVLDHLQRCPRSAILWSEWRPLRYRPKALFDACLRRAIFALSSGAALERSIADARSEFMQSAADPGLDILGGSPWEIAKDYTTMYETILRVLGKMTLLALSDVPSIEIADGVRWRFLAHADESGTLHRWITVASWDADALARELHGWYTFGDMAVGRRNMMLHVVVIGQQRKGRHGSPWARGWRHPGLARAKVRFLRTNGLKLDGYDPVYLADSPGEDADEWVEVMLQERAVETCMKHVQVNAPTETVCADTLRQIVSEAERLRGLLGQQYHEVPMSRGACDGFVPCPFQDCCYRNEVVNIESLGLYRRAEHHTMAVGR